MISSPIFQRNRKKNLLSSSGFGESPPSKKTRAHSSLVLARFPLRTPTLSLNSPSPVSLSRMVVPFPTEVLERIIYYSFRRDEVLHTPEDDVENDEVVDWLLKVLKKGWVCVEEDGREVESG